MFSGRKQLKNFQNPNLMNKSEEFSVSREQGAFNRFPGIGYRCWKIQGGLLTGAIVDDIVWGRNENFAFCREGEHLAPHSNCHCGINVFNDLPSDQDIVQGKANFIWGAVAIAGKTLVHDQGARAEKGQIIGFYLPSIDYLQAKFSYEAILQQRHQARLKEAERVSEDYGLPIIHERIPFIQYVERLGKPLRYMNRDHNPETNYTKNNKTDSIAVDSSLGSISVLPKNEHSGIRQMRNADNEKSKNNFHIKEKAFFLSIILLFLLISLIVFF